jgi:glutamate synthase domain-containing protein 2/glutamate synthase domain-containing protein 1/glutamate synthase domain-containing protein 3
MSSTDVDREHDACGIGFLADLTHKASHDIVRLALDAVGAMVHRGARAADGRTGDGAGMLVETPRAMYLRELAASHIRVPERHIAAICLYLPRDADDAAVTRAIVEAAVRSNDVAPLRWRTPGVDPSVLGAFARESAPVYEQLLVDMGPGNVRERMRVVRRAVMRVLRENGELATLISASPTTVVYKGLLSSNELGAYFSDLRDSSFASRFAVFHQRFSTNTAPQWRLVQPFNYIAHNGEINTITGNRAWMRARGITAPRWASDSHDFDTNVDAMVGSGYKIDAAVDLMLSPAVDDDRLRAYYDAHIPAVEPWDGPAAMCFTDGDVVGAALDRSGFRPLRWCRTASDKVLCASETGVIDFGNDPIVKRGRLGPGGRIVVRFASGELVEPGAFAAERRERADFQPVVRSWRFEMPETAAPPYDHALLDRELVRFGYTKDEVKDVIGVIAAGNEPVSSMGDDASAAFLERRLPVAAFLRQRFAQVTNPPIDSLREGFVFDMRGWVGAGDTNGDVPAPGSIVMLDTAVLDETAFDSLRFDTRLVQHVIALDFAGKKLAARIAAICDDAENAVKAGKSFIVLDDRHAELPIPAVLAAGAIHQRLTASGLRMAASIAAADGFARDGHSIATVIAAGANVVTPWLALRAAERNGTRGAFLGTVRTGLVKIMAKLGICTLRSYVGAQTFESLGLGRDIMQTCFPGMRSHVPAVGFEELESDIKSWSELAVEGAHPPERGLFRFRRDGVRHAFDPNVIKTLRASAMRGDYEAFEKLSDEMQAREPIALRDLLEALPMGEITPLDAIEPAEEIVKHFVTAAMSIGALSPEAHETIAIGAARLGALSNSGEGGEQVRRYARTPDSGRSTIKQVASARFGVGATYLASADEIEIKMAQGSKPGEGGQIPGFKVSPEIALLRGATPGQALISPPPHHDIYSIEDLAELIYDLRRAAPQARIAVKLVSQAGIGYVASGVAKARADVIHISGHDGGTGASPLASIKNAGLPWELGLVETHHALITNGLRSRVKLRVDGGFKTGRDVVLAAMLGADDMAFGSALLVALGCIYARQCHKNTCPVGIATQDPDLRKKFKGTPEDAQSFLMFIARDVRRRLARLGAHSLDEVRGRSDLLRARSDLGGWERSVDLSAILRLPPRTESFDVPQIDERHIDEAFVPGRIATIRPADRAVGARVAHTIVQERIRGEAVAHPPRRYEGSAGQSFGAFLTDGLVLELDGDANDYVGKGMEGGKIVVRSPGNPGEPAIGNACFYGARGGEAFVSGGAGERLAVRNSGATIVVEGAGDHACEYMTAGTVVILGRTGRNFASGMSGGEVFVLDGDMGRGRIGPTDVVASVITADDPAASRLQDVLEAHLRATGSARVRALFGDWERALQRFRRFAPMVAAAAPEPARPPEQRELSEVRPGASP